MSGWYLTVVYRDGVTTRTGPHPFWRVARWAETVADSPQCERVEVEEA